MCWVLCAGCKDINPGGSKYEPNTNRAHADWAFEHYYLTDESYTSCFFASNAYLRDSQDHKPPLGHYELTKDGRLMYPTPAKTQGGTDTIAPGGSKVWTVVEGLTGNWVGTNAIFRLWLTGSVPGCRAHAEIAYDFNGDGKPERTEVYSDSSDSLRVLPEYEAYTNAVGTDDSTSGDYASMQNGKVSVTVFNDKDSKGAIQVMVATNESPSFITVPYHNGPEIRPPPPPKPVPSKDCPTWYESFQRPAGSERRSTLPTHRTTLWGMGTTTTGVRSITRSPLHVNRGKTARHSRVLLTSRRVTTASVTHFRPTCTRT